MNRSRTLHQLLLFSQFLFFISRSRKRPAPRPIQPLRFRRLRLVRSGEHRKGWRTRHNLILHIEAGRWESTHDLHRRAPA